jgi:hypothetical protein
VSARGRNAAAMPHTNALVLTPLAHRRLEKPDLLLSEYMAAPEILPSDLGEDPHPRKTMNPNSIAGELTMPDGSKVRRKAGGTKHSRMFMPTAIIR